MIEGKQSLDKLSKVTPIPYSDTSKANAIVYPNFGGRRTTGFLFLIELKKE